MPVALPLHATLVLDAPAVVASDEFLGLIAGRAARVLKTIEAEPLAALLVERERQLPTATPEGIAFPHAIDARIDTTLIAMARLRPPLPFGTRHPPCRYAFVLFGPDRDPWAHVRMLARLARIVSAPEALDALDAAEDAKALRKLVRELDRRQHER